MKFNYIVKGLMLGFLLIAGGGKLEAQPLTELSLLQAYELLDARYPLLQDGVLLKEIYQKEIERLAQNRLPILSIKADGRLQSQSTQLTVPEGSTLPFEINQPLVSAKTYVEAQYVILDGRMTQAQRRLKEAQLKADIHKLEVDRFALRERINTLFLNIDLMRANTRLFDLSLMDLAERKAIVQAGITHGTITESERQKLEVKELELKAERDNLIFQEKGFMETLESLTGAALAGNVDLQFPTLAPLDELPHNQRPELEMFQAQRAAILAQTSMIDARRRPQLSVYAQGGVGYPNPLNILDNQTAPYGIVGAQFSWQLTDWHKSKLDKEILTLNTERIQHAEETFQFNLNTEEARYKAEVTRLHTQISSDTQIANLQKQILEQMQAQLDEGTITSADYLIQVNAELAARQALLIHQSQLRQTQIVFWNQRGAF
ncbi:MAG: TolC family protein [Bacteroidota bacterium]